jgi:hypothetical protein
LWTVNELPVIYEEKERGHSSTETGSTLSDSNEALAKKDGMLKVIYLIKIV